MCKIFFFDKLFFILFLFLFFSNMNSSLKSQSTDISMQEFELSQIFQEQYYDIFHEILHLQQNQFISNLLNNPLYFTIPLTVILVDNK